ncbi:uridine kinase [Arthrobacter sp. 3Tela_A]|uniref:uridine kinase n=1 Tax=Arthrobacter sp. 3Tela_A TaxID=3093743 RepID=UPI003BB78FCB
MTPGADQALRSVAALLPEPAAAGRRVFIGIDGVDGAGKTTFADALGARLQCPVIRISTDGFHRPTRERYRQGRASPRGFFEDSYDYGAFRNLVVDPLRPGGSGRYRTASHDLASDRPVQPPELQAPELAAVLVDGLFLHRPELSGIWDATVFLDVSFETSCRRLEQRDSSDPNPRAPANGRYVRGQEIYLAACDPRSAASVVVDYNDGAAPRIVRCVPWAAPPARAERPAVPGSGPG